MDLRPSRPQWKTPYGKNKRKGLSTYQRNKFISIFLSQSILFYIVPYLIPGFKQAGGFFADSYAPVNKDAYVYVYNGFTSLGGFAYIFLIVPVAVWFLGRDIVPGSAPVETLPRQLE